MRITQRPVRDSMVLELHGMLIAPEAQLLDATVRTVSRTGPHRLVLDLTDVPSIDAAGLGALVAAYGVVRRHGGTLRLAHVARRVHALLAVCRLVTVFETFDSVEDAVAGGPGGNRDRSTTGSSGVQLSQTSLDVIQHFLRHA
jgi:anti-sigma B factor antagonist